MGLSTPFFLPLVILPWSNSSPFLDSTGFFWTSSFIIAGVKKKAGFGRPSPNHLTTFRFFRLPFPILIAPDRNRLPDSPPLFRFFWTFVGRTPRLNIFFQTKFALFGGFCRIPLAVARFFRILSHVFFLPLLFFHERPAQSPQFMESAATKVPFSRLVLPPR